ncbi:MAG: Ger(x)C family spore germination protein [Bacillota bacterium]
MNKRNKLRPFLAVVLAVSTAVTLAGCWSRTEIEVSGFVLAMGLDVGQEKPIRLVAQLAVPAAVAGESGGGDGGQQRVVLLSAEGNTVSEAILELQKVIPHRLFWGHADLIVMTSEFAERGLFRETDIFLREREFRPGGFVYVTSDRLEDVFATEFPTQPGSAMYIQQLTEFVSTHSTSSQVMVAEFGSMLELGMGAKLVPMIKVDESSIYSSQDKPQKLLRIEGSGVVSSRRLITELTATETRGILWVLGKVGETIVFLENPGEYVGSMGIRVLRNRPKIRIDVDSQRIEDSKVLVSVIGEADIMELEVNGAGLTSEQIGAVNTDLSRFVQREITHAIHRVQSAGADVLGLAELFRRSMPAARWKEIKSRWESIFPELEFFVEVDFRIRRRGMSA